MDDLVSLVIPVYNEADHLERFLEMIDRLSLPGRKELVVVDDRSTDNSLAILKAYPFSSAVQVIEQQVNAGKGAAIRAGIARAQGAIIGVQDADFEYDPTEISKLVEPLLAGSADVVYGSRFKDGPQVHRTFHYLVNRVLTMLSNLLSGLYLSDMETCYKFFRSDLLKHIVLESERFGFEPEVTAKIARLRLRVLEFPISYFPRNYIEGKKIGWRDGVAAVYHLVKFNLFTKDAACFRDTLPERYRPGSKQWL